MSNPDSWINGFSCGEQAEDYIGKVKKDFGSGIYVEINQVVFEHTPIFQNGKQVFNEDGSPKTYISNVRKSFIEGWNDLNLRAVAVIPRANSHL